MPDLTWVNRNHVKLFFHSYPVKDNLWVPQDILVVTTETMQWIRHIKI